MKYWSPRKACDELGICRTSLNKLFRNGVLTRVKSKDLRRTFVDVEEALSLFKRESDPAPATIGEGER